MMPYTLEHIHCSEVETQISGKTKKVSNLIGQGLGAAQESHINGLWQLFLSLPLWLGHRVSIVLDINNHSQSFHRAPRCSGQS
jgi:hypothetical protein